MASSGKKKTTMAKLNRERKLRERRLDKQTKKDARKQASHHHAQSRDVRQVAGVRDVENLLHPPGVPAPASRPHRGPRATPRHGVSPPSTRTTNPTPTRAP